MLIPLMLELAAAAEDDELVGVLSALAQPATAATVRQASNTLPAA
ncbi:MAG TPA: hypothetical protein VG371_00960 [Solirubrobacteraceae bacterium]|jgi:hypothetical protein|nr:hypothetical protein [Solirubrobacteraceae bacterium]